MGTVYRRNGKWTIFTRINGQRIRRTLDVTKQEAVQILKKLEGDAVVGEYGLLQPHRSTVKRFIEDRYWPLYGSKLKSQRNYRFNLDRHILPMFGDRFLDQVRPADVLCWRNELEADGLKSSTINRLTDLLGSIYTRANKWGDTRNHPCVGFDRLAENNEREYYLTQPQYQAMMHLIDCMDWPESVRVNMRAAITLAIQTCLRKSNLCGLRWDEHVDLLHGVIRIPGAQTKNGEPVRLPLFAVVRDVLAGLPRSLRSQYVLTSVKGRRFNPYYEDCWPTLRDRMHEEDPTFPADFHWHDWRATGASWLTMAGISEQAIKAIMNLKSSRVLGRYAHLSLEHVRDAGNSIRGMFGEPQKTQEREG